ncbi:MAG: 2-oxoglutarate ferredoxin oxidoreductase subunit alpha, partial [Mycobacterium sp.]|nr:2-oxoglutarate ferredoxin oxidoreductase subunit alpha [Mycobacterium sp.]
NPLPANTGDVLHRYPKVLLPEMNLGQLALLLRGRYLVDVQSVTKVEGMAFRAEELETAIDAALDGSLAQRESEKTTHARSASAVVAGGGADTVTAGANA